MATIITMEVLPKWKFHFTLTAILEIIFHSTQQFIKTKSELNFVKCTQNQLQRDFYLCWLTVKWHCLRVDYTFQPWVSVIWVYLFCLYFAQFSTTCRLSQKDSDCNFHWMWQNKRKKRPERKFSFYKRRKKLNWFLHFSQLCRLQTKEK
jgi:hypothetical protein